MKISLQQLKKYTILGVLSVFVISCSEDADNQENLEGQLSQAEVNTLLDMEDITSSVDSALAELYDSSSAKSSSNECYSAEYTDNGFTATFNNCVLNGSDNINGTLVVAYGASQNNAEFTATYTDFYVGQLKINGTRTFNITATDGESGSVSFTITSNIAVEMEDGSEISESGTKTLSLIFEENEDTLWNLTGEWTVQKDGNTYSIAGNISKQFVCEYWSSGSLTVNKNGLEVGVDFGDGTCDNKATLTYPNGASEDIDL